MESSLPHRRWSHLCQHPPSPLFSRVWTLILLKVRVWLERATSWSSYESLTLQLDLWVMSWPNANLVSEPNCGSEP
ncbi:hypothetical protein V6N12_065384 [Hibiscus sabdariffa]|uniref:Uncharacterized protein n=1 Tax=Hibiscus sabdariffa TaxID=183260 RepID=A0ABR2G8K2_9ROSI